MYFCYRSAPRRSSCAFNTHFRPGDAIAPGIDEIQGLLQKLNHKLAPPGKNSSIDFTATEVVGVWYRPNFNEHMVHLHSSSIHTYQHISKY